jgi:uncharacterized protein (TIGR02217 family)
MTTPFLENPRFPDDLAVWARGGVSYNTTVTGSTSGRETRNSLWQYGRGQWDLQNCFRTNGGVADPYSIQTLRNMFRTAKGQAYGFRFRDWTDYTDEGNGILGALSAGYGSSPTPSGTGLGVPQLQLYKAYVLSPLTDYRLIAKPQAAAIYRNGVLMTVGTGAGQVQLDTTTGIAQFTADSSAAITGWTPGSSTKFTVAAVPSGWTVGTTLYFANITGDTTGVINNLPVAITAITGTTITVGANSSSLTLTGGNAYKYPQPAEAMTWVGTFDTPVRFATDQFAPQLDVGSGALYGFQTLAIVEIRP